MSTEINRSELLLYPAASGSLPLDSELDIGALSRLFSNTTNSYKYIFFLSYLDILKRRNFTDDGPISFRDMTIEMMANSWYPHTYFKLSFGYFDRLTAKLDSLKLEITEPILKFHDTDKGLLRETISRELLDDSLMRFVPFRLIRPFFESEVNGLQKEDLHRLIVRLAKEHFESRKPLYRFTDDCKALVPHPRWTEYFKRHIHLIRGWASWHWLQYMQRCNPAVPAISAKLFPPLERESLDLQKDYWKLIMRYSEVRCIYSGESLDGKKISLDHYLPWSFVAHDQLWNLIPTSPKVNSSKSDRLPAEVYFDRLVTLQHQGLLTAHQYGGERKWKKYIEPFIADLRIASVADLLDREKLLRAYEANLKPQLELARAQGFSPDWLYGPV